MAASPIRLPSVRGIAPRSWGHLRPHLARTLLILCCRSRVSLREQARLGLFLARRNGSPQGAKRVASGPLGRGPECGLGRAPAAGPVPPP